MPDGPTIAPEDLAQLDGAVLIDARRGGYADGHLRGARRADLERDLAAPDDPARGGRHPLPELAAWCATLGRWGIGRDTPVVCYDDVGGAHAAARVWWMLRAVGHERTWVLDGGLQGAVAAGHGLVTEPADPRDVGPYPADAWVLPIADAELVDLRRQDPGWRVVDARAAARWRGEVEPFDPIPGRIPGSVNLPYTDCVGPDRRLLPRDALAEKVDAALGDTPATQVIASCGSGVTACHTLLVLEAIGRPGAALYVGSFGEWCRQPRPIGRG